MKDIKIKRLLTAVILIIQLIWYATLVVLRFPQPDLYKHNDFSIYYTAGRIADTGRYDLLYDLETQRGTRQEFLGVPQEIIQVLPFNHPPMFVPLMQISVDEDYTVSYWRWVAVLAAFVVVTMVVLNQLLREEKIASGPRRMLMLASVLFYPLFISFFRGQDSVIVLLGLMILMFGLLTGRDAWSGAGLGLTVLRPQIAIMLAIPFLFKRRKVWWWFCGVAVFMVLYSLILVGWNGARDFIRLIGISARGEGFGIEQKAMLNFTGLILRIFPSGNVEIIHTIAWGLFCAGLVGLCIWWRRSPKIQFRQIVAAVTLSLFVAPHLHYHDLTLLLIPCLGAGLAGVRAKRLTIEDATGLLTLVSFTLMVSVFWLPILNILPYLWMAALVWVVWRSNDS
jgi:hypothetical protein